MSKKYAAFEKQNYLSLETFRKSGVGVKTPVWFVQDGHSLYIRTVAESGKVKRIHNNPQVNIAPCKMYGALLSDWIQAEAHEVSDLDIDRKVDKLLGKKYGLMKKIFALAGNRHSRRSTILELKVRE
jgi:PPOX class probable F420-dependent enzyme